METGLYALYVPTGGRRETRTATRPIKHETLAAASTTTDSTSEARQQVKSATEIRDEEEEEEEGIVRTSQSFSLILCISRAEQSDQIGWVPADEREQASVGQQPATCRLQAKTKGNEGAGPTQSNPT